MRYVTHVTRNLFHSCLFQFSAICVSASRIYFLFVTHVAEFVVIHNGIITNYKDITTYLVSDGSFSFFQRDMCTVVVLGLPMHGSSKYGVVVCHVCNVKIC